MIKKVDNVRIAFIGLFPPDINAAIQKTAGGKGYINDPIETAQEITGKLRGQADITELFWCRWQIELFFKWIKQHLRIKAFYGTTANAAKTQIWIAIAVYVLVAIVKKQLHLDLSL